MKSSDTRLPVATLFGFPQHLSTSLTARNYSAAAGYGPQHPFATKSFSDSLASRAVLSQLVGSLHRLPSRTDAVVAQAQVIAHTPKEAKPLGEILSNAGQKALGGGVPGMAAMAVQVLSLMWLRTTINYQYRYGTGTMVAMRHLYKEGGIPRFYRGVVPALVQAPLSRFGDTAANAGTLAILNSYDATSELPVAVKTVAASLSAASFRILLMPVDAIKTIMQVEGSKGLAALMGKVSVSGPRVLFHGALAASAATFAGHYPWFFVYNSLSKAIPDYDDMGRKLMRAAAIGFCSSAVSDTVSNSIRVVKTTKQTATTAITYRQAIQMVVDKDGVAGLFGRGLKTKIVGNGMQGIMFTVMWRLGQDWWSGAPTTTTAAT